MKRVLLLSIMVTILITLAGCGPKKPPATPQCVDISVMGVTLLDAESLETVLGTEVGFKDYYGDWMASYYNDDGFQMINFVADKKRQPELVHYIYAGRVDKAGIIFYPRLKDRKAFVTGKGIKVGMTKEEVKTILGKPHEEIAEDYRVVLHYRIDHPEKSKYLRYYNQQQYVGKYRFVAGKLKSFEFGFKK